jgi:hypothetical protein
MTEDQKKYINAMKKASTKKPLKALPRPYWKPQALVFAVITNKKFDMIIMGFIGGNMVSSFFKEFIKRCPPAPSPQRAGFEQVFVHKGKVNQSQPLNLT